MKSKMQKKAPFDWSKAIETPVEQWQGTGNIKKIHKTCYALLQRIRTTYKAYHGGKKPTIQEALTWALSTAYVLLSSKLDQMESMIDQRKKNQL